LGYIGNSDSTQLRKFEVGGYHLIHVDKRESKYELYSRTGNIDKLLSDLPEYKE